MKKKPRPSARVHTLDDLEKMHTRQLLYRLRFFHKYWNDDGEFCPERTDHSGDRHALYEGTAGDAERERSSIKQLLLTREHVKTKEESRQERKDRKKSGTPRQAAKSRKGKAK